MKNKAIVSLLTLSLLTMVGCRNNSASQSPSLPSTDKTSADSSSTNKNTPSVPTVKPVEDVDVVANTKLNLDDDVFQLVMQKKSDRNYDADKADFNAIGVERMLTASDYEPNKAGDVFTNYVDGDTTQFTTYNGIYNVKVRYLAVDTPESTSEIEEWGKTASNFNKGILKKAKHIIVQSAQSAMTGKKAAADLDGYGRSLAYVWYTNVDEPKKEDFRNLNLELVYAGYSLFSGSRKEMKEDFYDAFMLAYDIASYHKKGRFSGEKDPNFYYGDPKKLALNDLYDTEYYTTNHKNNPDDNGTNYSIYCDYKTKYTFEGVVSRKIGNSFYLQDKIGDKYYGLYCFTMRAYAPVKVGNRIRVSGVLTWYGGAYELCGLSYSFFNQDKGDIEYVLDSNGKKVTEDVTPIKATVSEINSGKYNNVLCQLVDDKGNDSTVYFNNAFSVYDNEVSNYLFGGSEELNGYNSTYPFYNTDNAITLFGRAGNDFTDTGVTFDTLMSETSDYVRVKIARDILISDENNQGVTSYRYFSGTKDNNGKEAYQYYSPKHPSVINAINKAKKIEQGMKVPTTGTYQNGDIFIKGDFYNDETNPSTLCDVYVYGQSGFEIFNKKTGLKAGADGETVEVFETGSQIQLFRKSFKRKKVKHIVGIVQDYWSVSKKNHKFTINIAQANGKQEGFVYDFDNFEEVVE